MYERSSVHVCRTRDFILADCRKPHFGVGMGITFHKFTYRFSLLPPLPSTAYEQRPGSNMQIFVEALLRSKDLPN